MRDQPDERPAPALSFGPGVQIAVITVPGIVLISTIVMRAGGASEGYLARAVFATVAICGATTILQGLRVWRIGSGHVVIRGGTGSFIAVCDIEVEQGGPALLATLVVVSSVVPILLAARRSPFQRLLPPTVSGTVIMLMSVTAMPAAFDLLAPCRSGLRQRRRR